MGSPARAGVLVLCVVMTGCALLSGAADLMVVGDDSSSTIPRDGATPPEGSPSADGAPPPEVDATADGASTDAAMFDAAPLPASRLRYIHFEGGIATGTFGVDEIDGTGVVTGVPPLSGGYSLRLDTGVARVKFPSRAEIWISLLFTRATAGDLVTFQLGGGQTLVIVVVDAPNGRLAARARLQNSFIGTSAAVIEPNKVARLGVHLRQGNLGDGSVEAWVVNGNAKFGSSFTSFGTVPFFAAFDRVDLGGVTAKDATNLVVDDIQIDDAAMPPP